ncbi:MAG: hypothetical protein IK085_10400 [Clostridia bacterium]|nr:hypothetical protein [Clostridia bacterium]
MSILSELNTLFDTLDIPVETTVFSNKPPEEYVVLTPLTDTFDFYADNGPEYDVCEVRITLFSQKNYMATKNRIVSALLSGEFTVTLRQYAGRDDDTGYHNYTIDVQKHYTYERN